LVTATRSFVHFPTIFSFLRRIRFASIKSPLRDRLWPDLIGKTRRARAPPLSGSQSSVISRAKKDLKSSRLKKSDRLVFRPRRIHRVRPGPGNKSPCRSVKGCPTFQCSPFECFNIERAFKHSNGRRRQLELKNALLRPPARFIGVWTFLFSFSKAKEKKKKSGLATRRANCVSIVLFTLLLLQNHFAFRLNSPRENLSTVLILGGFSLGLCDSANSPFRTKIPAPADPPDEIRFHTPYFATARHEPRLIWLKRNQFRPRTISDDCHWWLHFVTGLLKLLLCMWLTTWSTLWVKLEQIENL